jgi:hypothetical protein
MLPEFDVTDAWIYKACTNCIVFCLVYCVTYLLNIYCTCVLAYDRFYIQQAIL